MGEYWIVTLPKYVEDQAYIVLAATDDEGAVKEALRIVGAVNEENQWSGDYSAGCAYRDGYQVIKVIAKGEAHVSDD